MGSGMVAPQVREVASGLGFTEGPVWTRDGRLVVTSMTRGLLYDVAPDGSGVRVLAEVGGGPNGLTQDGGGTFWVAQNGGVIVASRSPRPVQPGLQRVDGDGTVVDVLTEGFAAPNDLVFGPDGRLWFTEPRAPADEPAPGRVWAYEPGSGEAELMASDIPYPNGLVFSPDGGHLLLADTDSRCILRFRWSSGSLAGPEVFARLERGAPDGVALDAEGNLFVAATDADAVLAYRPDGSRLRVIDLGGPSMATNVCFGGAGMATLFVTAAKGGRVLAVDGDFQGAPVSSWD
jgi:gluconolactonase